GKKIGGYDTTTFEIVASDSAAYFYSVIDNPKSGKLKVLFKTGMAVQSILLLDSNDKVFFNYHSTDIEGNKKVGISYVPGDNYYTIDASTLATKNGVAASKIVISFMYDMYDPYIYGEGVVDLNALKPFKPISQGLNENIEILTPSKLVLMQNREMNIYFNNIVRYYNTDKAHFMTVSGRLSETTKFSRFKPTSAGDVSSTISLYTKDMLIADKTKTITLKTLAEAVGSGLTKDVLFIGDSLTDAGVYPTEIANLFANDVMKVNLLGTRGT
ncbi:hypothetical protein, partial [Streptomyces tendae]|uniref:hypothetical protein n=1 Tax=Streptomyces tendae TaxID=1932 RepID=UPI003691B888